MAIRQAVQSFAPSIDAAGVENGMDVRGRDGEMLGIVKEVWAFVTPHGEVAKSRFGQADYGPIRGIMHLFEGADGYLEVRKQRAIGREGEQTMYIPLQAILDSDGERTLTVTHTNETCRTRFSQRPV